MALVWSFNVKQSLLEEILYIKYFEIVESDVNIFCHMYIN